MQDLQSYPFTPLPLPYDYSEFEPFISRETLIIHHQRLYTGYVNKLNNVLKKYPKLQKLTLKQLILQTRFMSADLSTPIKNNAGGVFNHELYFKSLSPNPVIITTNALNSITRSFSSVETFKELLSETAMSVFGSGYVFVVRDNSNSLKILKTANQDTPNLNAFQPLLALDVWEHSYFLDHKNKRQSYIDCFLRFLNWSIFE